MSWRRTILVTLLATAATAGAAHGATIPVTTTLDGPITDQPAQDGLCSLREAMAAAAFNAAVQGCPAGSGADVVTLPAGTFTLTQAGSNEDQGFTGDLDVAGQPVRVAGAGAGATVIQAGSGFQDRFFDVLSTGDLTLEGLTLRGARLAAGSGGGARNQGRLTVLRVAFDDDAAANGEAFNGITGGGGGAIWSGNSASPSVTVAESTFTANRAGNGGSPSGSGGDGGAIRIESGTLSVARSTFAGNVAGRGAGGIGFAGLGGEGGAIAVGPGTATITGSTFAGNRGGASGTNSSGSLNPAGGNAGAVAVTGGQALIDWSTFQGNVRGEGSAGPNGISAAIVGGSILADPDPRCGGVVASLPNLLTGPDGACLPGSPQGDPRLGLLQANGGPTLTLLPGAGSAAINGAAAGCPATDQRGLARPALGACDFGAVEVQAGTPEAVGAPVPGGGGGAIARTITGLKLGSAAFRAVGRKPLGTTVTYELSEAGTVVLTVRKPAAGKRKGAACVAPTRKLRAARGCTRQVTLPGKVTSSGVPGPNVMRFSGRLRGRALPAGRYTLVLTLPKAGSLPAVTATKAFRVLG